jgi:hypothetical protein
LAGACFLPDARVAAESDGSGVLESPLEGSLIDCHDVDCFQRRACNLRVRAAMSQIKSGASEVAYSRSDFTTRSQIALQVDRLDRLRTFVAPECRPEPKTPGDDPGGQTLTPPCRWSLLAQACQAVSGPFREGGGPRSMPPATLTSPPWFLGTEFLGGRITSPKGGNADQDEKYKRDWRTWLKGRWDGWLSLDDGRSARLWFRITGAESAGFVKACSDHGLVLGSVDDRGALTLPRLARFDLGARILVWRGAYPNYEDLEGIVLVEVEPGREIQNGHVWLSRALSQEFAPDQTDYPCQSPELLDRRKDLWFPDR